MTRTVLLLALGLPLACQSKPVVLSEAGRAAIADSVRAVVDNVFVSAARLDAAGLTRDFSTDPDARRAENGVLYLSVEQYRQMADSLYRLVSSLTPKRQQVHVVVLGPDAAAVTVPFTFTFRSKRGRTGGGDAVWSAVVQRRGGRWQVIQSHESLAEPERVMRELGG